MATKVLKKTFRVILWWWSNTSSSWVMRDHWWGLVWWWWYWWLADWHSNANQVMKLNSSSQQRNMKYEFHYLPKLVLVTIKWKQKWRSNIQIEFRSVEVWVLGVSESWGSRSLESLGVSNHELYLSPNIMLQISKTSTIKKHRVVERRSCPIDP